MRWIQHSTQYNGARTSRLRPFGRLGCATFVATMLLTGCSPKETAQAVDRPTVKNNTVTFAATDVSAKTIVTGKVEGPRDREVVIPGRLVWDEDRTVRVFTPFSGRVERVLADLGTKIGVGQALAYLQSPDFAVAQTDARKSDAALKNAKLSLARVRELANNGIVATKDLQQAEADFAAAEAESRRATARLQLYGQRTDGVHVEQQFMLTSPIKGVVVERNLNPGQELRTDQPGAPQFVVTDPSHLWVQLDASEAEVRNFKPGMAVLISNAQYVDDLFRGEITQVADFIDPVTRTLKVRATVPNADRRLKAEMFVSARITLPKSEYPSVPDKAVYLEGMRNFVFLKTAEGEFARIAVRVGANHNGMLPVLSGLKEGDNVVVTGALLLQQTLVANQLNGDPSAKAQATAQKPTLPKS